MPDKCLEDSEDAWNKTSHHLYSFIYLNNKSTKIYQRLTRWQPLPRCSLLWPGLLTLSGSLALSLLSYTCKFIQPAILLVDDLLREAKNLSHCYTTDEHEIVKNHGLRESIPDTQHSRATPDTCAQGITLSSSPRNIHNTSTAHLQA